MAAAGSLSSPAAATPDSSAAGTKRKRRSVSSEAASPLDRPSRERKSVERYVNVSPRKPPPSKLITTEQGPGTMLKDIPNVFFKVSKRKSDETLQALHKILFGRRPNAHFLKRNIFQFSGFVWSADEVKQKMKVKEKLDKCNKDRLSDFCELLDIQIARATPKDEITAKLLEFLESPSTTRSVILSEEKKKSKHKKRAKGVSQTVTGGSSERETKVIDSHKKKAKGVSQTVTGGSSERETKKRKSSLETEAKKRKRHSAKAKKRIEYEESLSEKEDEDEHISAAEEDLDEEVSNDNTLPNAEKDNHGAEQENDQAETMKEDEGDMPETLTVEKKSSEEQKSTEIKIQEEDLSANGDSDAKSDITTIPVPMKDSSDAEDVPDVPSPKKRGSLKGKTSRLSEANANDAAIKKGSAKIRKTESKSSPRETSVDNGYSSPPSSSKSKKEIKKKGKSNDSPASKDTKLVKKQAAKPSAKVSTKKQGKEKPSGKANAGPSTEEIRTVIIGILANVDFDTTTLADIIKQLGASFNKDLMDRKREVKQILEEEIDKMSKEESTEVEDDDSEDDGAK